MKIIKVLVDEMPSGCKRCNFCVAKMYCSLLEDRKTTVPDEPYKRRADCPLVYDFGDRETNALNKRIAELEAAHIEELEADSVQIQYICEDELPEGISDEVFSAMYPYSKVNFVRMFPFVMVDGDKCFLIKLPEVQNA